MGLDRTIWVLLLLAVFMVGCGPESSLSVQSSSDSILTNVIPVSHQPDLRYHVTRIYSDFSVFPPRTYEEEVWFRSDSEYHIQCNEILEGVADAATPAPAHEKEKFNSLLKGGQGRFAVFHRGFKIRDAELFLDNYNYFILNANETFLGRSAALVKVTSRYLDRPGYTVWIDNRTGLILKYIEETLSMSPLSVMEVTSLDLDPDFTGVDFPDRPELAREELSLAEASSNLSTPLFVPEYLPKGFDFQYLSKGRITSSTGQSHIDFHTLSYTDGVQTLVIGQYPLMFRPAVELGRDLSIVLNRDNTAGLRSTVFFVDDTQFTVRANLHEEELQYVIYSLAR
jgi:hypothetical protein